MTLGEAKKIAVMLIDEFTQETSPYTTDPDIAAKLNPLFGLVQNEVAQVKKIPRVFEVVQNMPMNQISEQVNIDTIYIHDAEDVEFTGGSGMAYYFEVDDEAEVHFEQSGADIVEPIIVPPQTGPRNFIAYKGILDAIGPVTIRFSGSKYYNIKNVALWGKSFSSTDRIPDYKRFIAYDLPTDFYQLERVNITPNPQTTNEAPAFSLVGKTLTINAYCQGVYRVEYFAYPKMIDASTPDTYEFEIDNEAQMALPYGVAADILKTDPSMDYTAFEAKYSGKLSNLDPRRTNTVAQIKPLYNGLAY